MIPRLPGTAVFHFEARSSKKSPVLLQWTSRAKTEVSEDWSQTAQPGRQWQAFSLPMQFNGTPTGIYLTLPEGGAVELRNLRVATSEGTVMMEYGEE